MEIIKSFLNKECFHKCLVRICKNKAMRVMGIIGFSFCRCDVKRRGTHLRRHPSLSLISFSFSFSLSLFHSISLSLSLSSHFVSFLSLTLKAQSYTHTELTKRIILTPTTQPEMLPFDFSNIITFLFLSPSFHRG